MRHRVYVDVASRLTAVVDAFWYNEQLCHPVTRDHIFAAADALLFPQHATFHTAVLRTAVFFY